MTERTYLYFDGLEGSHGWTLYKSNGESVTYGYLSNDAELWLDAGEYLFAFSARETGNYGLKVSTPALPNLGQFTLGSTIAGSISEKGQQNTYKFQGVAGQQLFFDGMTGSNITARIYDPTGRGVFSPSTSYDYGPENTGLQLTQSGTYTVIVEIGRAHV